jgi:hypothetical protein
VKVIKEVVLMKTIIFPKYDKFVLNRAFDGLGDIDIAQNLLYC